MSLSSQFRACVRHQLAVAALAILGALVGCSSTHLPDTAESPAARSTTPAAPPTVQERERATLQRERARWVAADWSELPGWGQDRALELWPALTQSCARPAPGWSALCASAALQAPADDLEAHLWLMKHLQPWRIESLDGSATGLLTGYFEPQLPASRKPQGAYRIPLHAMPPDAARRQGLPTRAQIEQDPAVRARLKPYELAYLADPMDALLLQIQGSGRLQLVEPDGRQRQVRMAYAGHNEQPYQSLAKQLLERGEITPAEASWPGLREWARRNPQRAAELSAQLNPRYVFFREEPLGNPEQGPRGAQGVPLTPGRSIAVDRGSVPYGTPVWLDATEPLSSTPLRRLVMAQDTGNAIAGAVRADFFWGWGAEAETQAGRMKQPLRMWALWPREATARALP
jgi:membrane-bound lytic murein transglycosylase A